MSRDCLCEVVSADLENTDLTLGEKEYLIDLLIKHQDVFAENFAQMVRMNLYEHEIRLKDPFQRPIKQHPYHTSIDRHKFLNQEIQDMLDDDVIKTLLI